MILHESYKSWSYVCQSWMTSTGYNLDTPFVYSIVIGQCYLTWYLCRSVPLTYVIDLFNRHMSYSVHYSIFSFTIYCISNQIFQSNNNKVKKRHFSKRWISWHWPLNCCNIVLFFRWCHETETKTLIKYWHRWQY